jgi:hypothetical protein
MSEHGDSVGTMEMYHPWRALRAMTHVDVQWVELPDGVLALGDGETVWMDRRQRQAQRRSTIAHELEHLSAGDTGCQSPAVERRIDEVAAAKLVSLDQLAEAIVWAMSEEELALDLWVDVDVVRTRLGSLTEEERDAIDRVIAAREESL